MTTRWIVNGIPGTAVSADDRGLQYGDGLFETIAWRDGSCRFLDDHLQRLQEGCTRLGIPVPASAEIKTDIDAASAGTPHGVIKVIVTRGVGPRGYAPPLASQPTLLTGFTATEFSPTAPLKARICATRLGINRLVAGCKTLNRLEQVMARAEWDAEQTGIAEGLMLNELGQVVCGTMSNLFLVASEELVTPLLDSSGVSGVMRKQVLRLAASAGINVRERAVSLPEVFAADGLFLTNALMGLAPIAVLDGKPCPQSPLTEQLRAALAAAGVAECNL